jgi:alanyl-tRNA synthetase
MRAEELRKKFIEFFVERGHEELPAASLIPENDPSVLFTTAGMQQFKRFYINPEKAPAKNVVTIQPCLRTSDIDEVGDESHLTFFEMLGNFSFGGYWKKEAIQYAWEFLTETLGINKKRLSATYYDTEKAIGVKYILFDETDIQSSDILEGIGINDIKPQGQDNFWTVLEDGHPIESMPGGRTVEFYVNGSEIWNLVFNEAIFKGDHWDWPRGGNANLGIDTGMGLERLLAVLENQKDIYKTELFWPIIEKIEEISGKSYQGNEKAFRIIADHIKAATFLSAEDIVSSNIGQGYILRRLIRRAVRYGWILGIQSSLVSIVDSVLDIYRSSYRQLNNSNVIKKRIQDEEQKFLQAIQSGLKKVDRIFSQKKPIAQDEYSKIMQIPNRSEILGRIHKNEPSEEIDPEFKKVGIEVSVKEIQDAYISGKEAFDLYQTYGFPLEMILDLAQKKHLFVGISDFKKELENHQRLSRTATAGKFKGGLVGESEKTTRMHTATHLLLKALQEVLGPDVHQKGSNINEERIRFDFSYDKPMTEDDIKKVEEIVNQKIKEDLPVIKKSATIEEAKKMGAEAQFIEKYQSLDKELTMYSIDDPSAGSGQVFSAELCGGPHVKRTGEIGHFKIIKAESSSSGVRRIKAILD